ncbi:MAG TPA: hypothetical protein VEG39_05220 [Clostridia bacterium]|nr:hypothetical protein [Clostridia bacterium]
MEVTTIGKILNCFSVMVFGLGMLAGLSSLYILVFRRKDYTDAQHVVLHNMLKSCMTLALITLAVSWFLG